MYVGMPFGLCGGGWLTEPSIHGHVHRVARARALNTYCGIVTLTTKCNGYGIFYDSCEWSSFYTLWMWHQPMKSFRCAHIRARIGRRRVKNTSLKIYMELLMRNCLNKYISALCFFSSSAFVYSPGVCCVYLYACLDEMIFMEMLYCSGSDSIVQWLGRKDVCGCLGKIKVAFRSNYLTL